MEPRIQYAKTTDGVNIAFFTLGEGMPVVEMPTVPDSHHQLLWHLPEYRTWCQQLAHKRRLVTYDARGTGLSERNVTDFSLDALVLDLEAVVDHLELETFAPLGVLSSGPVAIAYSARHPERVSHLILCHTWARTRDTASPQLRALARLVDTDWETYTETAAHIVLGWSAGDEARQHAVRYRESVTQETMQAFIGAWREVDVAGLLPQVKSPALVLHRREVRWPQVSLATGLASGIPGARLALLEGTSIPPFLGDPESVVSAIDEFLGEGEEAAAPAAAPSGLVTILFTDMESSTALRQRLGDANAQELLRTHNTIVRDGLKAHGGSEIKHTGDGIMASFPTASGALECAVAIQRGVAAHLEQHPETPLRVYMGLNAGEPIAEERDLFGTSVDLARRICDRAEPGEILVSDVVRQLAAGKGFLFSDIGEVELRGFEDPVRLYEVRWREEG